MSLDNIVQITITSKSLHMTQAGFGTPLIIAKHEYLKQTVTPISNILELFNLRKEDIEKALPKEQKFENQPLYRMVQSLFAQSLSVPKIKIGKRDNNASVTEALAKIIKEDADGDFYGLLLLTDDAKEYLELADAISDKKLLAGIDLDKDNQHLAEELKGSLGARRIFSIYKEDPEDYPAAAWMGRMLCQSPGSSSWAYKDLIGIKKSKLNTTITEGLKKLNINRHIDINDKGVTLDGKVASGEYIDIIHGIDWLHVRIQERIFRLLMLNEKIPYTLKGIDLVRSELIAQLDEGVARGLLAADPPPEVSIPNIETIPKAKKEQRILPDVSFCARLAGAIHTIEIRGTVES